MTTLTPFRLFQLVKYSAQKWAAESPVGSRLSRIVRVGRDERSASGWLKRPEVDLKRIEGDRGMQSQVVQSSLETQSSSSSTRHDGLLMTSTETSSPRPSSSSNDLPPPLIPPAEPQKPLSEISRLMADATMFTPDFLPPRNIVVLCHGLYGFSTATPIPLFPSLKLHYWRTVLDILRDTLSCKVLVVGVKGTGSIQERALMIHDYLEKNVPPGTTLNFVAHSMGGLDVRYLISTLKPGRYGVGSLTMIGTPNRGSPFMDWCAANIGVGAAAAKAKAEAEDAAKRAAAKLPPYSLKSPILSRPSPSSSLTSSSSGDVDGSSILGIPAIFGSSITKYLLGLLDSPAYSNLTTHYLNDEFNPATPDDPNVKYISVAGRITKMSVLHPLWFPKLVLDAAAQQGYAEEEGQSGKGYEGNDGLVSVSSARWGEFLGTVDGCHHWDLRGEGGLFPTGGTTKEKPEGRPDAGVPGGWDWKAMGDVVVKDVAKDAVDGAGAKDGMAKIETLKKGAEAISQAAMDMGSNAGDAIKTSISNNLPGSPSPSTWDVAQVRQVVDWVADLIPGVGGDSKDAGKVGDKQMADAVKEKAREESRLNIGSAFPGMTQTGQKGKPEERGGKPREKKEKFDLGKFYGGLMVKLREEGF